MRGEDRWDPGRLMLISLTRVSKRPFVVFETVAKSDSSETEEDEFFDCDDDEGGDDSKEGKKKKKADLPIWTQKPEGREQRLGKLKLLEHDDYIYVPVCQVCYNLSSFSKS